MKSELIMIEKNLELLQRKRHLQDNALSRKGWLRCWECDMTETETTQKGLRHILSTRTAVSHHQKRADALQVSFQSLVLSKTLRPDALLARR